MDKKALSFLKELVATPTPSGSEQDGQKLVAAYIMGRLGPPARDSM